MIEIFKSALVGQYHAALSMLQAAVEQCPEEHWHGLVGAQPFSHVAYHTLFYTDFYLTPDEASYRRPSLHREEYQVFGGTKLPPDQEPISDSPISREVILQYIGFCRQKVNAGLPQRPKRRWPARQASRGTRFRGPSST